MRDSNGEFYYNDDFVFTTDVSSTLSNNREAMWHETRMNFTTGAYGNPTDLGTLIMFWQTMHTLHYPGARQALNYLEKRKQEQLQQQQEQMVAEEVANRHLENVEINSKKKELESENAVNQMKQQMQQMQGGGM
jgi:hypothetical protein